LAPEKNRRKEGQIHSARFSHEDVSLWEVIGKGPKTKHRGGFRRVLSMFMKV